MQETSVERLGGAAGSPGRVTNSLLYGKILPRRFASIGITLCVLQWMLPRDYT